MAGRMETTILPEPTPEEREAIEGALARLPAPAAHDRGDWWHAGVEEGLADPADGAPGEASYSQSS